MTPDDLPSFKADELPAPTTRFASPTFSRPETALDPLHEAAKQWRPPPVQSGPATSPSASAARDPGSQPEQRQQQREPEAADEPEAAMRAPARVTGRVFGGSDVHRNMTELAMRPIESDSGSLLDADLAAMPGGPSPASRATCRRA